MLFRSEGWHDFFAYIYIRCEFLALLERLKTKTAYIHLVKTALSKGFTVSVWDGEEWQVKRSTSYQEINQAIKSVEEAKLRFRDGDQVVGSALVSAYGLEPDETVIDCSSTPWIDEALGWS